MKLRLAKNLEPIKKEKLAQIDADANRALESYRTPGGVAALAYGLKRDEVSKADAGWSLTELRMLQAESNTTGIAPEILIETWRQKIAEESASLVTIEAARQALKTRIKNATTLSEVDQIAWV